jgi:alpha-ketoglutarate-dependent taurine dioxygenase
MYHTENPLGSDMPIVVWSPANGRGFDLDGLTRYLADSKDRLSAQLDEHGGVLLRGFDCVRSSDDYQKVLDVVAPDLMDYVGGTSPRKVVNGRIMTATEIPGTYSIPLHQEMSYTDNSPDRISFFCERPATEGGETTIGDMRAITRNMDAAVRARFEAHGGVQLCRNLPLPDRVDARPGVPKTWHEVFATKDRSEAEKVAGKSGWRFEWMEDGSMQLWQEVRPTTRLHPRSGDEVWFNQVHIFSPASALKWAREDGRTEAADRLARALEEAPQLLDHMRYGDGTEIEEADVLHIYDVLTANARPVKWQAGDVLILDNILVAHGRRKFAGDRSVLTALIQHAH